MTGTDRIRRIIERVASGDLSGRSVGAVAGRPHDTRSGAWWLSVGQIVQPATLEETSASVEEMAASALDWRTKIGVVRRDNRIYLESRDACATQVGGSC